MPSCGAAAAAQPLQRPLGRSAPAQPPTPSSLQVLKDEKQGIHHGAAHAPEAPAPASGEKEEESGDKEAKAAGELT